jgi:integrase
MPREHLTASFARTARCPRGKRKLDFFDTVLPGFLLEVRASGGRTFYVRYRDERGRERQLKVGSGQVIDVGPARRRAKQILAQVALGADPQQKRQDARDIPSFRQFVSIRYLPHATANKRSWKTDETMLRLHILPALGKFGLDEVSPDLVAELVRKMRASGYSSGTTNRAIVLIRFIFNLAKRWGVAGVVSNPVSGLRTEPDVCRERYLNCEEVGRLVGALDRDENQPAADAIRLLLLTGARRNEVTQARWEDVDWTKRTLRVPMAKSGRARLISLSAAAIDVLKKAAGRDPSPFIFPSGVTGRPCPSLHFPWTRIRRRAGLDGLRLHDLRHSFASFLVNNGVSLYVVQGLLGHTQPSMTQRYAHLAQQTLLDAADIVGRVVARPEQAAAI